MEDVKKSKKASSDDKIVIAPQNWFRASEINTKDLVPDSWIRI